MARIHSRRGMKNNPFFRFGIILTLGLLMAGFLSSLAEAKKLNVVTSTTDMAALTQEVGGEKVSVESIAKGYQDPHFVEAKPSFLLKLRQADLVVVVGLQLEIGWLPPLITQSGNPRIQVGAPGYLDASQFAEILEIPQGTVTRAMGDVHPMGNPPTPWHTWELSQLMMRENCKVVLVEPYFDLKTPQAIGRETGAQVVVYLPSVGGEKGVDDYFKLFDYDISLLIKAFNATK